MGLELPLFRHGQRKLLEASLQAFTQDKSASLVALASTPSQFEAQRRAVPWTA